MANYIFVGDPIDEFEDESFRGYSRRQRPQDIDCCVKIENKIDIEQNGTATGGDGGAGGDNNSAAAAAASRGGVGVAVPVTVGIEENDLLIPEANGNGAEGENTAAQQPNGDGEAEIGTIAVAAAGNGGAGGDAEVNQSVYANIDNWTVIVFGNDGRGPRDWVRNLKLDSDNKEVKLKVKDDEVSINGEKLDIKELKDGTKVFILKQ